MVEVKFSDAYTLRHFIDICEQIEKQKEAAIRTGSIVFDLSGTTFVDPFGMITLIGLSRHLYNVHRIHSNIILPDGDAGAYMERGGLDSLPDPFIKVDRKKKMIEYFKKNQNMGVLRFFSAESDIKSINAEFESWMESNSFSESEIHIVGIDEILVASLTRKGTFKSLFPLC